MNIKNFAPVTMFVGLPGCGKTTFASAIVHKILHLKKKGKNINVFSNVPIRGAYQYDWLDDFGYYQNFANSYCICDEAGLDVNNREWEKNFDKQKLRFLKLTRHYSCTEIYFSQTWNDCDIKIRQMVGLLYILKKSIIPGFTVAIPVFRKIDVDEETHEFKELYYKDHPILRIFSSIHIWRKKYYKYFDSWDAPVLPTKKFDIYT